MSGDNAIQRRFSLSDWETLIETEMSSIIEKSVILLQDEGLSLKPVQFKVVASSNETNIPAVTIRNDDGNAITIYAQHELETYFNAGIPTSLHSVVAHELIHGNLPEKEGHSERFLRIFEALIWVDPAHLTTVQLMFIAENPETRKAQKLREKYEKRMGKQVIKQYLDAYKPS